MLTLICGPIGSWNGSAGLHPLHYGGPYLAEYTVTAGGALDFQHQGELFLAYGIAALDALKDNTSEFPAISHLWSPMPRICGVALVKGLN